MTKAKDTPADTPADKKKVRTYADLAAGDKFTAHGAACTVIQADPLPHFATPSVALTYTDDTTGRHFDRVHRASDPVV